MTRTLPLARTLSLAAVALVGTLFSFAATTAPANAVSNHYYSAELATPLAKPASDIQKGVQWSCEGDVCLAPAKGRSRDMIVCQRLTNEFGDVTSFRAGRDVFDAAQVAQCNS